MKQIPTKKTSARQFILFSLFALFVSFMMTRGLVARPGFTDAYYHYNAAQRLVTGQGLTDAYLWNYIGAPEALPVASHLYWMPLTSLAAAAGMWLPSAPGDYAAAQLPFTLMLAAAALLAFWLGRRLGGGPRQAWVAGSLTLLSGYFTPYWGATDTFGPYALAGGLCLLWLGLGAAETNGRRFYLYWALAGAFVGLAHLTRADGPLLLLVGGFVLLYPAAGRPLRPRLAALGLLTACYLLVMLPWFARNMQLVGWPLPLGGADSIWFIEYDELFNYPPGADPQSFFADGPDVLLESRWLALSSNLGRFVAEQGLVVMTPLMLLGLYVRRRDPLLRPFWLYALGLHLVMTLVFPYPGYRGGLFHSAAALVPWWAALGVVGLDASVDWAAKRLPHWQPDRAKVVFSLMLLSVALTLSLVMGLQGQVPAAAPPLYTALARELPPDARVMVNDPAALYYFTGLGGVVLPNASYTVIPEIAERYGVRYLLLEGVRPERPAGVVPGRLAFDADNPPDFLRPLPLNIPDARLYEILD